jgi:hypothetical protein
MVRPHAVADAAIPGALRRPIAVTVLVSVLLASLLVSGAAAETADRKLVIPGTTYVVMDGASQLDESGMPKHGLSTSLAIWLSHEFGLPLTRQLPKIRLVSSDTLAELRYGRFAGNKSDEAAPRSAQPGAENEILAVYDDRAGTVYLSEDWTGRGPAEISVFAHEMVHHLQNLAGDTYACPAEREKLAYQAQERFLGFFGQSLESAFSLDPMTLLVRTTCGM